MNKKDKKFIWGPITVIVLVLLMVLSSNTSFGSTAKNLIGSLASPVQSATSFLYQKLNDGADFLFGSREMKKEYEELKKENKVLRDKLVASEEVIARANFLENEYKLLQEKNYDAKEAYVIGRSSDNVFSNFRINIGTSKGVSPGDVVIQAEKYTDVVYKEALVGQVIEAGLNYSIVSPITADESSISFYSARTLDEGILSSYGKDGLKGYAFEASADIREGDKVLSSGLGENYPRGIYIGEVSKLNKSDEYGQQISVETKVDFNKLYRVMVVTKDMIENE